MAGGIEYGFMSFTTDRGRVTEEAERLRREAEEETARKRREVEEAERKHRETEEAERKRREAEGADHERNREDVATSTSTWTSSTTTTTTTTTVPHDEPSSETMRGLKCLSVAITRSPWSKPRRATSGLTPPQTKACRK